MEIVQNRYGQDRVIEKISHTKLRVMGESLFSRNSKCVKQKKEILRY